MSDNVQIRRKPGPKKKKIDRPISADTRIIDLDTPVQKLLEWDKAGARFQWDFERFPYLTGETLTRLGKFNRDGYSIAKGIADKLKEQQKEREEGLRRTEGPRIESPRDKLELDILGGSASGKTRVEGGLPGTHYCSKRPDEIDECLDAGYVFVGEDDPVKTPGMSRVGNTRRIARHGEPESFLMKVPEEKYQKHIHAVADMGKGDKARAGYNKEGRKLKKKYSLEFSDTTKRVRESKR